MAWQFPQSETTAGATVNLGTLDDVFVAKGVYLASTGQRVIDATGSNHTAIIEGILASGSGFFVVRFGDNGSADSGQNFSIGVTGEVHQFNVDSAVAILAFNSVLTNAGLISALEENGEGITMSGSNVGTSSRLTNSGRILAFDEGVIKAGSETLIFNNSGLVSAEEVFLSLNASQDILTNTGTMNGDVLLGDNNDTYDGAKGRVDGTVFGGSGNDKITGGARGERLEGDANNDTLRGNAGNDNLFGDAGKDKLYGGKGNDNLTGGSAGDTFYFASNEGKDKVLDFVNGADRLDFKAFNFASKAEALSHFDDAGAGNNDKVHFNFGGTDIVINGIDLAQLNGADIVI